MVFQQVDLNKQRLMDSTSSDCSVIQTFCGYLVSELSKFFALPHVHANYGVVFTADDYLVSTIFTPFGMARGRLDMHLVDDVISGRYVFEKKVVSEDGADIWTPVWAIRISRLGIVLLGDEGDIEISVTNIMHQSNSISAPAKSLMYSIASTPTFKK